MSTVTVTEEAEIGASAILVAGQAVDVDDKHVLLPLQIVGLHARVRVSSSAGGPIQDATGATDVIPVGHVRVNIKLKKKDFVSGDPSILGEIVRQLQQNLKDGIEIQNLSLASQAGLPPNLKIGK